jgi:hypothetical protein
MVMIFTIIPDCSAHSSQVPEPKNLTPFMLFSLPHPLTQGITESYWFYLLAFLLSPLLSILVVPTTFCSSLLQSPLLLQILLFSTHSLFRTAFHIAAREFFLQHTSGPSTAPQVKSKLLCKDCSAPEPGSSQAQFFLQTFQRNPVCWVDVLLGILPILPWLAMKQQPGVPHTGPHISPSSTSSPNSLTLPAWDPHLSMTYPPCTAPRVHNTSGGR